MEPENESYPYRLQSNLTLKAIPPIIRRPDNSIIIGAEADKSLEIIAKNSLQARRLPELIIKYLSQQVITPEEIYHVTPTIQDWFSITSLIAKNLTAHGLLRDWVTHTSGQDLSILIIGKSKLATALRDYLLNNGMKVRLALQHDQLSTRIEAYDLLVLCDFSHLESGLYWAILHSKIPHLIVNIMGNTGNIGPLVMPGETACGRCEITTNSHIDQYYQYTITRLVNHSSSPSPLLENMVFATAAQEITIMNEYHDYEGTTPKLTTLGSCISICLNAQSFTINPVAIEPLCGCQNLP